MSKARQRELCLRCLRATSVCLCSEVDPIELDFDLVILQHPRERRHTVASGRLTYLCFKNAHLVHGAEFGDNERVNALIDEPSNYCVVLYPGPRSQDVVDGWAPPPGKRLVVFVIDGTWAAATGMLRDSPNLAALDQIRFNPIRKSEYGFRKQPRAECLSTLEAVHDLLEVLRPRLERGGLLRIFRQMVSHQLQFTESR
jgi:DTW domain-containing protein YfiP